MIRFLRTITVAAVTCTLVSADPAASQLVPDSSRRAGESALYQAELRERIDFCRRLMRDQNYTGAADMLELLYERYPENSLLVGLLVQCYDNLQYYEKSQEMIRRHLERYPNNFNFQLLYAEVLAKQGYLQRANQAYLEAASPIPLSNQVRYQTIVQSMITNGLGSIALTFIDSLRQETGDSVLFALYRGTVLAGQERYADAALEFYSLLEDTTRVGNEAEKRIIGLLNFEESEAVVEKTVLGQADVFRTPRALKILSSHYLKTSQFEKAFDFTVSRDSLAGFDGRTMLEYMRSCYERRLYDQAVRMGQYLLDRGDTLDLAGGAYFLHGDALVRLGRYNEAVAAYDHVYASSDRSRDQAQALYLIGITYLNEVGDYPKALLFFDSVVNSYRGQPVYQAALVARPYCYLRTGQLELARTEFEKALTARLASDLKEEAQYQVALVYFLQKQIDSSQVSLSKLLVDYPQGMYVNDAVGLMFIIQQAQGDSRLLYDYSNALLFEQRKMTDSAAAKLGLIAGATALWKLAQISLHREDTLQAIAYVDRLAAEFPESYYLPYGLQMKADLFSVHRDRLDEAREIYRSLLESYPNFPFISAVRQKMRELEAPVGSS
jgi:tetratricopeptide (TPR) repeat protein